MVPRDIGHQGPYYVLGEGGDTLLIDKRKGKGKTLAHFLRHLERGVSLNVVQRVSGWSREHTTDNMRRLYNEVNVRSQEYEFYKVNRGNKVFYVLQLKSGEEGG
jgi:hypothetical protein